MKYTLIKEIGSGSFGKVHLAKNENGFQCAVKTLEPCAALKDAVAHGLVSMDELHKRFFREVKYQSKVEHPNVVRIIDSNVNDTVPSFAMELAESTLQQELASDRTLGGDPSKALFDILSGLQAIHEWGIFHRDLKPANVLKFKNPDKTDRYALSDFGLMTASMGDTTTLTATGAGGGTHNYAAPELINNMKRATAASDIYSFGVILFDIFGGGAARVPYTEVNLPGAIGKIASKCTKSLPRRRYSSIADLRADLYDAVSSEKIVFSSNQEQTLIELLEQNDALTEPQWDQVFLYIEEQQDNLKKCANIFRAFRSQHLEQLKIDAPDLLAAFGQDFCAYILVGEGAFNFNYCDVLADKLLTLFSLGETALKSAVLLALLNLGASHNRWYVEWHFVRLAGSDLSEAVAKKVVADVDILEFDLERFVRHVETSIEFSRAQLHPIIQSALGD